MRDQALGDYLRCDFGGLTSGQGAPACEAKREANFDVLACGGVSLSSMASEDTEAGEHFKNEMEHALIGRFRISPSWLIALPAVLLGMALEHRSGAVEAPCPVGGGAEIHYSPAEDLETIDVAMLREAGRSIWRPMC